MNNKLRLFQWSVGACDALTGILLVAAPQATLSLMGMEKSAEEAVPFSFVGIFVMAVGLSYFLPRETDLAGWKMQWKVTALMRLFVALFLLGNITLAGWDSQWLTVLFTDLIVGSVQFLGLKKGWLEKP